MKETTGEKRKAEQRVAFNLQIPESLHGRLKAYAEGPYARRQDSMTGIILRGLEAELTALEEEAKK